MTSADFLQELISIRSPSGQEAAVASHLVGRMAELGFDAHLDEVGNAVGSIGNPYAAHTVALIGHMDTVAGWPPVKRRNGRLYGRGAVDAKGPLATFVLAAARAAPALQNCRLVVVGVIEEEALSRGAHHLADTLPRPAAVVIGEPSGWQGITLGYKGVLRVDYSLEQSNGHSAGATEHPAQAAVEFWNALGALAADVNQGQKGRFNQLDPAIQSIQTHNDGLTARVDMALSLRLPPGTNLEHLKAALLSHAGPAGVNFPYSEPPYRGGRDNPLVRGLMIAIRAAGGKATFKLKTGTSDMNVLGPRWQCPIVAYGPGDSSLDHTPEEHIELDEFSRGIKILHQALLFLDAALT